MNKPANDLGRPCQLEYRQGNFNNLKGIYRDAARSF